MYKSVKDSRRDALHKMKKDYGLIQFCLEEDHKEFYYQSPSYTRSWFDESLLPKEEVERIYARWAEEDARYADYLNMKNYKDKTLTNFEWLREEIIKLEKEMYYV